MSYRVNEKNGQKTLRRRWKQYCRRYRGQQKRTCIRPNNLHRCIIYAHRRCGSVETTPASAAVALINSTAVHQWNELLFALSSADVLLCVVAIQLTRHWHSVSVRVRPSVCPSVCFSVKIFCARVCSWGICTSRTFQLCSICESACTTQYSQYWMYTSRGRWKRETEKRGTGKPGTKSQGWKTRDRKTGEPQSYGKPSL